MVERLLKRTREDDKVEEDNSKRPKSDAVADLSDKENEHAAVGDFPRGLYNESNTCYLNSLIQVLFHLQAFRQLIFSYSHQQTHKNLSVLEALQWLFLDLAEGTEDGKVITTNRLTKAFGWTSINRGLQQDIHEFMQTLFSCLEKELNPDDFKHLSSIFSGKIQREICCDKVDYKSTKTEEIRGLSLPTMSFINIERSLADVFKPEEIEMTVEGKGLQSVKVTSSLTEYPKVLLLTLNRLKYDTVEQAVVKVTDFFEYKEKLELGGYNYRLHSAVVHEGTAESGHYYCYISPTCNNQWFMFNDDRVSLSDASSAIRENYGKKSDEKGPTAYLLTYLREDCIEFFKPCRVNIPDKVRERIDDVRQLEKIRLERRQTAHLYTSVSLVPWAMLSSHDSYDVCDRLRMDDLHKKGEGTHDDGIVNIRVLKTSSVQEIMTNFDSTLNPENTRLWAFMDRETSDGWSMHRPDRLVKNWAKSVAEVSQMRCPFYMYLEKLGSPLHPTSLTDTQLSTFIKVYSTETKSLSLKLHLIVSVDVTIGDFKSIILRQADLQQDPAHVSLYQEVSSMSTEKIECDDSTELYEALGSNFLRHGTVIIAEVTGNHRDEDKQPSQTNGGVMVDATVVESSNEKAAGDVEVSVLHAEDYMSNLGNRVIVSWYNKDTNYLPSHEGDFTLELYLDMRLCDVIDRLANHLKCGPRHLRLFEAKRDQGYPQLHPHRVYDSHSSCNLLTPLYKQVQHSPLWRHSTVLYYQQLALTIEDMELRHTVNCEFVSSDLLTCRQLTLYPLKHIVGRQPLTTAGDEKSSESQTGGEQLLEFTESHLNGEIAEQCIDTKRVGQSVSCNTTGAQAVSVSEGVEAIQDSVSEGAEAIQNCEVESRPSVVSDLLELASNKLDSQHKLRLLSVSNKRILKICKAEELMSSVLSDDLRLEEIPEAEEDVETEFSEVLASVVIDSGYLERRGVPTHPFLMVVDRSDTGEQIQKNICDKLGITDNWREKIEFKLVVPSGASNTLTSSKLSVKDWGNLAYDDDTGSYEGCNYIKITDCLR